MAHHFTATEVPLGVVTTWASDATDGPNLRNTFDWVKGTVFSDTAGTLFIEQGARDATGVVRWDVSSSYAVVASDGRGFSEELVSALWRIRFVQAGNQAVFRLRATATAAGSIGG